MRWSCRAFEDDCETAHLLTILRKHELQIRNTYKDAHDSASIGSTTCMLVPPVGLAAACTRPLCVTTIFCTRASPRPVPPPFVVKNGWKIRSRAAGGIPGPLSSTAM